MRFVVLHHTGWPGRPDHYDLMLQNEVGASDDDLVLVAFATEDDRFPVPDQSVLSSLAKHRRAYLTYEGPLSGNRGQVKRVDEGELEWRESSAQGLFFLVKGRSLNGSFHLRMIDAERFGLERTRGWNQNL